MDTANSSELTHLREHIKELIEDLGEMHNLIAAMWEHVERATARIERSNATIRRRMEDFEMMPAHKERAWRDGLIERYNDLAGDYKNLVRQWNRYAISIGRSRAMGRPLQASEEQQAQVRRLRAAGNTLRAVAHETNLSIQTVRTIINRKNDVDLANKKGNGLRRKRRSPERVILYR